MNTVQVHLIYSWVLMHLFEHGAGALDLLVGTDALI